jgi:hypothetical protein
MPVVSKAMFRKFESMRSSGKISKRVADEFLRGVDYSALPERKAKLKRKWQLKRKKGR